ncbi:diacylglycerol/lipid kinase family protein, partial [candidate division KSB1 bacterium]
MKYYLILNPGSQSGKSRKKFQKIFNHLNESGIDFQYHITISLHDAYFASKEANKKNFDAIIAVGGDGTINAVLNGFFDDNGNRTSTSKFGIIYTGTSPDFCKSYYIPLKLDHAVNNIISCNTIKINVAKILLSSNEKDLLMQTRFFACCANVGLGAELARRANSGMRKYFGDFKLHKNLFNFLNGIF